MLRPTRPLRLLLCALLLASGMTPRAAETLTLCVESADVRPWRYADKTGLNFELIDAAAKRLGLSVHYVALPWKRCLAELQANQVDGGFAGSYKADRLAMGAYPGGATPDADKRLHTDTYVVLRRRGERAHWNGSAFSGLAGPVGIQLGYSVAEQLAALQVPVDDGSANARELLLKLAAGRVALAAMLAGEAQHLLGSDPALARQIEVLPKPLVEKPYYLLLSHRLVENQPKLAQQLWQAIAETRKSAAYREAERKAFAPQDSRP